MIYLYAVTDRPEIPAHAMSGLGEFAIEMLPYMDIGAVTSCYSMAELSPIESNLWRHEKVVESLMTEHTVLPVRFGTVLPNEAAVQTVLASHYTEFAANLTHVRGRVELSLRVMQNEYDDLLQQIEPKYLFDTGRAYMAAQLEEQRNMQIRRQEAEALAADIHAPLAGLAAENTQRVLATPRLLLTAAYLVDRDRIDTFQNKVRALSTAHPQLRLLCTGPWPPYHFVICGRAENGKKEETLWTDLMSKRP